MPVSQPKGAGEVVWWGTGNQTLSSPPFTVKQYIIDDNGRKVAAIIEIEELNRLEELLEDLSDIKSIEDRKNEPDEDYETYSNKRKP